VKFIDTKAGRHIRQLKTGQVKMEAGEGGAGDLSSSTSNTKNI